LLRVLTSGESHGPALTAIVDGLPSGLPVDVEDINARLARRQMGYGRGKRQQIEHDVVEFASGVRYGRTLPGPVTLVIRNRDYENWRGRMAAQAVADEAPPVVCPRPGHADFAGILKHELADIRDILERSSARSTAVWVAVGGLCQGLLARIGVRTFGCVLEIGDVPAEHVLPDDPESIAAATEGSPVRCADAAATRRMVAAIDGAAAVGDTLGGVFEVTALGVPPGLGSHVHWDRRLDARLAAALMSIQAVKGVEIGSGFAGARLPGSKVHDELQYDAETGYVRDSNSAGGIEGGISNGEPVVARCAMKPLPTLRARLRSVDLTTRETVQAHFERSDVCAVPAASVIGEAMLAFVLAQCALERYGGDSLDAFERAYRSAAAACEKVGYTGVRWSKR
jgi:chorismate synthase